MKSRGKVFTLPREDGEYVVYVEREKGEPWRDFGVVGIAITTLLIVGLSMAATTYLLVSACGG